ncbi:hypothetical protein P167DRAFT_139712 [Morchella conica CCBAS932]|uniref:Uncharacterized protein n=1 Tax=Morchella conica CCBAS932 TaxID=1392247 RepID=A0A3N4KUN0_9PEZI|nr:hypothetical protein P167DRAFT_139712 [Morchella conica CCBAS932]
MGLSDLVAGLQFWDIGHSCNGGEHSWALLIGGTSNYSLSLSFSSFWHGFCHHLADLFPLGFFLSIFLGHCFFLL